MKTHNSIKIYFILIFCFVALGPVHAARSVSVAELTCEYLSDPLGIGVVNPRLSWILSSETPDQVQSAYQVLAASSQDLLTEKKADLWNSGKVNSTQSIHIEYAGNTLESRNRCWWMVRVWDKNGKASTWSDPAYFEIGLLNPADWEASWIKSSIVFNEVSHASPMLRKNFELRKSVESARLYISSLGLYRAEINGNKIGDQQLTPGWTSFHSRIQYQTYDITTLLSTGEMLWGLPWVMAGTVPSGPITGTGPGSQVKALTLLHSWK